MKHCCVPKCCANSKDKRCKELGISFHEFPSCAERREKWLKNLNRNDWYPGQNAVLCSLHFKKEDFKQGCKRLVLKCNAIPSIFNVLLERPSKSLKSPDLQPNGVENDLPPQKMSKAQKAITDHIYSNNHKVPALTSYIRDSNDQMPNTPKVTNYICNKTAQNVVIKKKMGRPCKGDVPYKDMRACAIRINRLKKTIANLKNKLRETKSQRTEATLTGKLEEVEADHQSGVVEATLLVDLIQNYANKRKRWSESSVQQCLLWRKKFPRGYRFGCDVLRLPSKSTLQRYSISSRDPATDITEQPLISTLKSYNGSAFVTDSGGTPSESTLKTFAISDCGHVTGVEPLSQSELKNYSVTSCSRIMESVVPSLNSTLQSCSMSGGTPIAYSIELPPKSELKRFSVSSCSPSTDSVELPPNFMLKSYSVSNCVPFADGVQCIVFESVSPAT